MPAEAQPEPLPRTAPAPVRRERAAPAGALAYVAPAAAPRADALVTVEDVIVLGALGAVSDVARAAITAHLAGLLASLELRLNRPLQAREFVEDVVIGEDGRLWLRQSPVRSVASVVVHDQFGVVPMPGLTDPRGYAWRPGLTVRVTYTAGLDVDRYGPVVRSLVVTKALPWARALLARLSATPTASEPAEGQLVVPGRSPGVASFAVEGLNVTYETDAAAVEAAVRAAQAEGAAAAWTDVELASMGQLRRPVVA